MLLKKWDVPSNWGHHPEFLVQGMGRIDQIRNACGVTPVFYGT